MHKLVLLSQSVKEYFNRDESVLAVFIDFKRAFNIGWIQKLQNKLKDLAITGNMFNWLKQNIGSAPCGRLVYHLSSKQKSDYHRKRY